jgi:hypothetical protein
VEFERRSLYAVGKSSEPDLSLRIGSRFEIESPHSTKAILYMNLDGGSVNGLAIYAQYRKFEGTTPRAPFYNGNLFAG